MSREDRIIKELADKYGLTVGERRGSATQILHRPGTALAIVIKPLHITHDRNYKEAESCVRRVLRRSGIPLPGEDGSLGLKIAEAQLKHAPPPPVRIAAPVAPPEQPSLFKTPQEEFPAAHLPPVTPVRVAPPVAVESSKPANPSKETAVSEDKAIIKRNRFSRPQIVQVTVALMRNGTIGGDDVYAFNAGYSDAKVAEAVNEKVEDVNRKVTAQDVKVIRCEHVGKTADEVERAKKAERLGAHGDHSGGLGAVAMRTANNARAISTLISDLRSLADRVEALEAAATTPASPVTIVAANTSKTNGAAHS